MLRHAASNPGLAKLEKRSMFQLGFALDIAESPEA
jgi:hypothetical protein